MHIAAVWSGITGLGLMVTVIKKLFPEHEPDIGVTVYKAVCVVFVVFVSEPVMEERFVPAFPPVKPEPVGVDQVYVVPAGTIVVGKASTGETVKEPPLQMVAV